MRLLVVGSVLLIIAVGFTWFGFTTNNPNPVPALSSLAIAILSYIGALVLTSKGMRGIRPVQSPSPLRKFGSIVLVAGAALTAYAGVAFFLTRGLPPNSAESRLPSLYLLFAGMLIMFAGTIVHGFRLR